MAVSLENVHVEEELFKNLIEIAERIVNTKNTLFQKYTLWHKKTGEIIFSLLSIRDELRKHSFRSNCANLTGASATILGSIASIAGIVLMPITAGTSLALTIGGIATATTGGAVSAGSTVANYVLSKNLYEKVNEIFNTHISFTKEVESTASEYSQLFTRFQNLLEELDEEHYQILKFLLDDYILNVNTSTQKSLDDWCPTLSKLEEMAPNKEIMLKVPLIIQLVKYVMNDNNMVNIIKATPSRNVLQAGPLANIAKTAVSADRIVKSISETGRLFMLGLKEAGLAVRIGLSVLNAVFVIWGLVDLVTTSIDIHRGSETEQIKEIGKVVKDLKKYRKETKSKAVEIFGHELVTSLDT
ncbi:apolipoprotein L4-like [Centruroides vittatus]|uniref:apolipoprotein L4-like n=1 Tax=Centruroides vittatus TaxID=120091 RepID=UPI00350EA486